jgi:general secretion pathway protein K
MADSGIQSAIAESQTQSLNVALLSDSWASLGDKGDTETQVGQDGFRIQIVDAGALLNVNTGTEDQLKQVMTETQAESLIDWRESGTTARPLGAKDEYYATLANPYLTKLKPFNRVSELLLVKGFTPSALYTVAQGAGSSVPLADMITTDSASTSADPDGNEKVDITSATADQLQAIGLPSNLANEILQAEQQGSFTTLEQVLTLPGITTDAAKVIADYTTIGSDANRQGLVNVNTAQEPVLNLVPGMTPDVAEAIVNGQSTGYKQLGDLLDLPGIELGTFAKIVDQVTIGSRVFLVRVIGVAGSTQVAEQASLKLTDDGQVHVIDLEPLSTHFAINLWGWHNGPNQSATTGTGL